MFQGFPDIGLYHRQLSQGARAPPGTFIEYYKVYPAAVWGKLEVELGNKIIMPGSSAARLLQLNVSQPMMFTITNTELGLQSHCGVLEFTAEEGVVLLPYWLMTNLGLYEGGTVAISNATLQKATYVKIQPHKTEFIDLPNPKTVLENSLRSYACLTQGETIVVQFNNVNYELDILECRPQEAIMTIETDMEVDFAPPKDFQEAAPSLGREPSITTRNEESYRAVQGADPSFPGGGSRLDGKSITQKQVQQAQQKAREEVFDPRKHRLEHGVRRTQQTAKGSYWDNLSGGNKL